MSTCDLACPDALLYFTSDSTSMKTTLKFLFCLQFIQASGFIFVSRQGWQSPIWLPQTPALLLPVNRVFIHHTSTESCREFVTCMWIVQRLQKIAVETGVWPDVRFNFLIGGDGRVYEGTGWHSKSNHIPAYNDAIGIALIGNFKNLPPPDAQLQLTEVFITRSVLQGKIKRNFGLFLHSDGSCTSCPGSQLSDVVRNWPRYGHGGPIRRIC